MGNSTTILACWNRRGCYWLPLGIELRTLRDASRSIGCRNIEAPCDRADSLYGGLANLARELCGAPIHHSYSPFSNMKAAGSERLGNLRLWFPPITRSSECTPEARHVCSFCKGCVENVHTWKRPVWFQYSRLIACKETFCSGSWTSMKCTAACQDVM